MTLPYDTISDLTKEFVRVSILRFLYCAISERELVKNLDEFQQIVTDDNGQVQNAIDNALDIFNQNRKLIKDIEEALFLISLQSKEHEIFVSNCLKGSSDIWQGETSTEFKNKYLK